MAVGLSVAAASDLLDALLEAGDTYVQLHDGDPGAAGTTNVADETDRQQVTSWTGTGTAARSGGNLLTWSSVTVTTGTQTYTHASVWDAASSGNFLISGTLTASGPVSSGDTFQIAVGAVDVTIPTAS